MELVGESALNWEAIGSIGELVGAAGVIATLLFLAVQIRQNSKTMMATTFDDFLAEGRRMDRETYISNPENLDIFYNGLEDYESLSLHERRVFEKLMVQLGLYIENIIRHYEFKTIKISDLESWVDWYSTVLRTPGGAQWWKYTKQDFSKVLSDYMEEHCEKTQGAPNMVDRFPHLFSMQGVDDKTI